MYNNYWSPLACLVEAQEEEENDTITISDRVLSAQADTSPLNKVAAHWARKLANRKTGVLDSGATSGAGPEEDVDELEDTGEKSKKTFMFPDQRTATATKKMMLKHKPTRRSTRNEHRPGHAHITHQHTKVGRYRVRGTLQYYERMGRRFMTTKLPWLRRTHRQSSLPPAAQ